jgi:hypothetical protein
MNEGAIGAHTSRRSQGDRRSTWMLAGVLVLGALAWVLTPVVLLHPFLPQGAFGVALAYELRGTAPRVTLALLVLLLPLLPRLGGRVTRRREWIPIVALGLLAGGSTWFARQNHFEWMFGGVSRAQYAPAGLVDFVDERDMVVAVEIGGDAVAWPVRQMAYHHLVQDTVGGVPVVSTY